MARTIHTVHQGRFTARVKYSSVDQEYIVQFHVDGKHSPEEDYYTDDKQDAIGTAEHWCVERYNAEYGVPYKAADIALMGDDEIANMNVLLDGYDWVPLLTIRWDTDNDVVTINGVELTPNTLVWTRKVTH